MLICYVGPQPEVQVATPGGYVGVVRGEPVDFPPDVAKRLLEQDTWEKSAPGITKEKV